MNESLLIYIYIYIKKEILRMIGVVAWGHVRVGGDAAHGECEEVFERPAVYSWSLGHLSQECHKSIISIQLTCSHDEPKPRTQHDHTRVSG
jgi:hypothetical protein